MQRQRQGCINPGPICSQVHSSPSPCSVLHPSKACRMCVPGAPSACLLRLWPMGGTGEKLKGRKREQPGLISPMHFQQSLYRLPADTHTQFHQLPLVTQALGSRCTIWSLYPSRCGVLGASRSSDLWLPHCPLLGMSVLLSPRHPTVSMKELLYEIQFK